MNLDNKEYGKRIREVREYQKLSREKLAELSNISTQFLADIETGKKGMTVNTLKKICTALHITSDSIIFGTENSEFIDIAPLFSSINKEQQKKIEEIIQLIIKLL
ncbi:MAG: helix-turn-helix domain-containing protein [Clostridiales bacterium]|nr:helix-turn-helix domain-containing protein [Clostridiales bacterium]